MIPGRPIRHPGRRWVVVAVSLALIATACGSQSTGRADRETAPTAVAVPTAASPPTSDLTPPPATTTPEPTPTATPEPTPTPTPTPTATPTPEPATIDELLGLSSIESVPCPAAAQSPGVSCSIATLPRNIEQPTAEDTVALMVARVDNGDPHGVGPVVYLQGGPGAGSVGQAPNFVGASHDVVFFDQRGTGYSTPKLDCPEVDGLWESRHTDDPDLRLDETTGEFEQAYRDCAVRLRAEGIDFNHFNTTSAATDVELLRRLLGYDPWVVWGISYGTRLGLTVMRDHGDGVRAAILDSIVPFEVDFFATIPEHGLGAMRALDEACDADRCAADHGDFYENLVNLVTRLNDEPVVIDATRPGGTTFPFRVDGEELVNLVFTQMYNTRALRALPRQIARADHGGLDEIVYSYVSRRDPTQVDLSIGLYYATWCREEFPFHDPTSDDEFLSSLGPDLGTAVADALGSDGVGVFCDESSFGVDPAPATEDLPLTSAIPTLVFAGAFDPITPPAWSQMVADRLENAIYVEMADHGHGMATSCPVAIRLAFLMSPGDAIDTSCATTTNPPDFD